MKVNKKIAPVRGQKKIHPCVWGNFFWNFQEKKSSPGKVMKKKNSPPLGGEKKFHPYPNFLPPPTWKSNGASLIVIILRTAANFVSTKLIFN